MEFIEEAFKISISFFIPKNEEEQLKLCKNLCRFYFNNKDIFLVMNGPYGDSAFTRKFAAKIIEWTKEINKTNKLNYNGNIEQKLAIIFLFEGTTAVIYEWLANQSNMSIEEISHLLMRISYDGMNSKT